MQEPLSMADDESSAGGDVKPLVKKESVAKNKAMKEDLISSQMELIKSKPSMEVKNPDCGGLSQTSNLFLSFKDASNAALRQHPYELVDGEVVLEKTLGFETGWHVMKGKGCVSAVSWSIVLGVMVVIFLIISASVYGTTQNAEEGTAVAGVAIVVCTGLAAMLFVVKWIETLDRITSGKEDESPPKIYDYGIGIVLYFRWLKFLVCVFFCMSMISAPALYFFYAGTTFDLEKMQSLSRLGAFTLGSIGEASPICYDRTIYTSMAFLSGGETSSRRVLSSSSCVDKAAQCAMLITNGTDGCEASLPSFGGKLVRDVCPATCNWCNETASEIEAPVLDYIPVSCAVGQIASLKVFYGNPTGFCGCNKIIKPEGAGVCEPPQVLEAVKAGAIGPEFKYIWPDTFYKDYMDPTRLALFQEAYRRPGLNQTEMLMCTMNFSASQCQGWGFKEGSMLYEGCRNKNSLKACQRLAGSLQAERIANVLQPVLNEQVWLQGQEPVERQYCCGPGAPPKFYHEPAMSPLCNSATMQEIAEFRCLGKQACNLTLDENEQQPVLNKNYDSKNFTYEYKRFQPDGPRLIYKTIRDGLNYTKHYPSLAKQHGLYKLGRSPLGDNNCSEDGFKRMMVVAKCYDPMLTIKNPDGSIKQQMPKEQMALIVIGLDCLASALFLLMVAWLASQEQKEVALIDEKTISCEDYSLLIQVLPTEQKGGTHALAHSLKDHIEEEINSAKAKARAGFRREGREQMECTVEQIHFGLNNYELIFQKNHRQKLARLEERIERKIQMVTQMNDEKKLKPKHFKRVSSSLYKQRLKVEKRLHKLDVKLMELMNDLDPDHAVDIKDIDPNAQAKSQHDIDQEAGIEDEHGIADIQKGLRSVMSVAHTGLDIGMAAGKMGKGMVVNARLRALMAFVTFETEEGKLRALEVFKKGSCCGLFGSGGGRKFQGIRLQFEHAASPSNIKWENLGVGWPELFLRRILAFAFTAALLGLSAMVIVQVKNEQKAMNLLYPPVTCPLVPPTLKDVEAEYRANDFKTVGLIECFCSTRLAQATIGQFDEFNVTGKCKSGTDHKLARQYDTKGYCGVVNCKKGVDTYIPVSLTQGGGLTQKNLGHGKPASYSTTTLGSVEDMHYTCVGGKDGECTAKDGECPEGRYRQCLHEDDCAKEKLCEPWLIGTLTKQSLAQGAVLLIIVVNTSLKACMKLLVQMERKASVNEELVSTAARVFFSMFINTACIALVLNGNAKLFTHLEVGL
jgi:hypothetical protein